MFQSFDDTASPDQGPQRLADLRKAMTAQGLAGYLVPRADAHQGEYVAPIDDRLADRRFGPPACPSAPPAGGGVQILRAVERSRARRPTLCKACFCFCFLTPCDAFGRVLRIYKSVNKPL